MNPNLILCPALSPQYKKYINKWEEVQWRWWGLDHLPFEEEGVEWGIEQKWLQGDQRHPSLTTGMSSRIRSQGLHSRSRLKDYKQWASVARRIGWTGYKGKKQTNKKHSAWGQSGSGTGFPDKLFYLHPWKFSTLNWIKPWAAKHDLTDDHGLSKRLNKRPPEVSSSLNYLIFWWQELRSHIHCSQRDWMSLWNCHQVYKGWQITCLSLLWC